MSEHVTQSAEIAPYHSTEQCHECGDPYWTCRMGACPGDFVDEQDECQHEWELRSEHDTWVCCWCDAETTSPEQHTSPGQRSDS